MENEIDALGSEEVESDKLSGKICDSEETTGISTRLNEDEEVDKCSDAECEGSRSPKSEEMMENETNTLEEDAMKLNEEEASISSDHSSPTVSNPTNASEINEPPQCSFNEDLGPQAEEHESADEPNPQASDNFSTENEEDNKLLSDISELVDEKTQITEENLNEELSTTTNTYEDKDNLMLKESKIIESSNAGDLNIDDQQCDMETDTNNEISGSLSENEPFNEISNNTCHISPATASDLSENKISKPIGKESAFQRLASLGVISEEKPVIESKDDALKKLVQRGAISITPAGGGSSSSSIVSTRPISLPPTKQPKPKIGPKSVMAKQKAKKIKIDPGKSLDIDKDFNSLINILSTGIPQETTPVDKTVSQVLSTNEPISSEPSSVTESVLDSKPESEVNINDSKLNSDHHKKLSCEMDLDKSDDRSLNETDYESHDESKSISHSSELAEENDDRFTANISKNRNVIEEGSAEILLSATRNVFYNKVQEFNRDMSIAALTVFSEMHQQDPRTRNRGKKRKAESMSDSESNDTSAVDNVFDPGKKSENGITILEALSATGLRSIRYAREIPGVKEVIANDLSEDAVETIKKNIEHNGIQHMVTTSMSDASLLMYQRQARQEWYDAIDLDPYGCPSRFLDSAVQAVRDGGLLLVTCTDMAVLAGNSPETCYVKYGSISLRSPACHEMALRIALQCIESHANRYGRYIVPLLSFSADFYIRLIVQVYTSPVTCKRTTSKLSMVYQCVGCHTHTLHPLGQTSQVGHNTQPKFSLVSGPPVNTACFHCHHKHNMGGPIWSAPLYSSKFLESMLRVVEEGMFATSKRMQGMLEVIREELPDVPLYYTIAGLCTKLHCQAIPLIDIRSAILNAGYRVSSSHASPTAIKTNAPAKVVWDIMRCWVHMNPVSQKRLTPGSVAAAIILEPPTLIANFDIHPKARPSSNMRKLLRYQQNPEKNWGPGMRARCNNSDEAKDEKRRINQNKNKNKKGIDIIEVVTIDDEDDSAVADPAPAAAASTSLT